MSDPIKHALHTLLITDVASSAASSDTVFAEVLGVTAATMSVEVALGESFEENTHHTEK